MVFVRMLKIFEHDLRGDKDETMAFDCVWSTDTKGIVTSSVLHLPLETNLTIAIFTQNETFRILKILFLHPKSDR